MRTEKVSQVSFPESARRLGTVWQNEQADPVLARELDWHEDRGNVVVVVKTDHFDPDGYFEQWSKDYWVVL